MAAQPGGLPVVLGVAIGLLVAGGVAAAVVVDGGESRPPPSTVVEGPQTTTPSTTATTGPATTVTPSPSGGTLSRAEATRALCSDVGRSIQAAVDGDVLAGGVRLTKAVNSYGESADPSVVAPARRMWTTAMRGDLDGSAAAADEAGRACGRLGYAVPGPGVPNGPALPGGRECLVAAC